MKNKLSYLLVLIITAIITFNSSILSYADTDADLVDLISNYGVVIDYETGQVLGGENIHEQIYPASTTKIWTAYLVTKNVKDLDAIVEITEDPWVDGSSIYLQQGEIFTVKELLQGLLIKSGNDSAEALAKYVSGSIQEFAELMNTEAKAAGALNTHFNNPHGLPDDNHYSTPYDMAILARKAMSSPVIREIVKTKSLSFAEENTPTSKKNFARYFTNTNLFLTSEQKITYKGQSIPIKYDIVDGIKTGYTDLAGRCLLSSAVKDNMRVIAASYKNYGTNVYIDSRTLIDFAFENYKSLKIIDKEELTKAHRVLFTKEKEFIYKPKTNYNIVAKNGSVNISDYSYKEKLDYNLPIYKGDKVGTLEVYKGDKLEKTIDLVSTNEVHHVFSIFTENNILKTIFKVLLFLIVLFIIFILLVIIRKKQRRKKKKQTKKHQTNSKNQKNKNPKNKK